MKNISFTLVAVACLLISSCSNSRYGSLSKVKADTKVATKAEKNQSTNQVSISPENNSVEYTEAKIEEQQPEKTSTLLTPKTNFSVNKKSKATENKVENKVVNKYASKKLSSSPKKVEEVKQASLANKIKKAMMDNTLLIVIAFFIPFLAVGLVSDWTDTSAIIISILLTLLCWLPGFIHAIVYIGKNNKG